MIEQIKIRCTGGNVNIKYGGGICFLCELSFAKLRRYHCRTSRTGCSEIAPIFGMFMFFFEHMLHMQIEIIKLRRSWDFGCSCSPVGGASDEIAQIGACRPLAVGSEVVNF